MVSEGMAACGSCENLMIGRRAVEEEGSLMVMKLSKRNESISD